MARKKKAVSPLQGEAAVFQVGIVLHVCCPGFHMLPETARTLGLKHGNYLQVEHEERGTRIVRELVSCNRGCPGMRKNYLYMDSESAHYLGTDLHDPVTVKLAEYEMDSP